MENIIDLVIALKNVSIFKNIPDHILADIAAIMTVESVAAGEQFIFKGKLGDEMYIIRSGEARIHDGETQITTLKANEIVGELAILAPVERTADATAITDLVVFVIKRDYFADLLSEQLEIVKGVLEALVQRIIQTNKKLNAG